MSLAREGAPTVGIDAEVDGIVVVSRAGERVDDEDEDRIESNRIESNRIARVEATTDDETRVVRLLARETTDGRTTGRMDEWTARRRARCFFSRRRSRSSRARCYLARDEWGRCRGDMKRLFARARFWILEIDASLGVRARG